MPAISGLLSGIPLALPIKLAAPPPSPTTLLTGL